LAVYVFVLWRFDTASVEAFLQEMVHLQIRAIHHQAIEMILKLKSSVALITLLIGSSLFFSFAVQAQRIQTEFDVRLVAEGLKFPWGMAFMPDGNVLVTEKIGQLRIITPDGRVSEPIKSVPAVFFQQQGGLLDVALDPEFSKNRLIYLSYAEPEGSKAGTAVARAELKDGALENLQVIFRQQPKTEGSVHFGSRWHLHRMAIFSSPWATAAITWKKRRI